MIHTIMLEIARVITIGRSVGFTKRKASLWAKESTTSNSKKKATGHMMIIHGRQVGRHDFHSTDI